MRSLDLEVGQVKKLKVTNAPHTPETEIENFARKPSLAKDDVRNADKLHPASKPFLSVRKKVSDFTSMASEIINNILSRISCG